MVHTVGGYDFEAITDDRGTKQISEIKDQEVNPA